MNKKKLLAAAVAATVLAVSGGVLAGCNTEHTHTYSEDWKSDATGHWHVATCDDLKEGDEAYKNDYAEHVWGNDNVCDVCKYTKTSDTPNPPATTEYTVTLNLGDGTLADGAATTLTTVNGKIATLPTPTAPDGKVFDGWYTAATNGTKVTATTEFKANTTIYAVYKDAPREEFTVTLNVGEGTLPAGTSGTLTTVNGKLAALPKPEAPSEELAFKGWYTAAEGGEEVTLEKEYTENTTIHAQWRAADGLYTTDGTFIAALEEADAGTFVRKLGCVVELEPGAVITIKVDGELLQHHAGAGQLWDDGANNHGATFNQAAGTFTVNEGEAREFTIYAQQWHNSDTNNGWTIYMTDGIDDAGELVEGGSYLVGDNFGGGWKILEDFYIDEENGLQVTFAANSTFKIVVNNDGSPNYNVYNTANYKMKDNLKGYLIFPSGSNNGTVSAPGTYTITIELDADENPTFVFTPDESVTPAPSQFVAGGYYVAGKNFNSQNEIWAIKASNYIDPENGIDIVCTEGAEIQITSCKDAYDGGENWAYKADSMFDLCDGLTVSGGTVKVPAGSYRITVDTTGDDPVFTFTAITPEVTE